MEAIDAMKKVATDRQHYEKIKEELFEAVKGLFPRGYTVTLSAVQKNNGIMRDSIVIKDDGHNIAPSIFLDEYYERYCKGCSVQELASAIKHLYFQSMAQFDGNATELMNFGNFFAVKDKLIFKLINAERNEFLLKELPHIRMGEFAVILSLLVQLPDGSIGTVKVTHELEEQWGGISLQELVGLARENTPRLLPAVCRTMAETMSGLLQSKLDTADEDEAEEIRRVLVELELRDQMEAPSMYVLTNKDGTCGAATLLYPGLMDEIRERIGEDFFVIPSSIHELILVPVSAAEEGELTRMVGDVNAENVPPMEVLGDRAFRYPQEFPFKL